MVSFSLHAGVWRGCNSKFRVCLPFRTELVHVAQGGMIFMRVHKYWLDYDLAALVLLIIGMTAVELLALIIM